MSGKDRQEKYRRSQNNKGLEEVAFWITPIQKKEIKAYLRGKNSAVTVTSNKKKA